MARKKPEKPYKPGWSKDAPGREICDAHSGCYTVEVFSFSDDPNDFLVLCKHVAHVPDCKDFCKRATSVAEGIRICEEHWRHNEDLRHGLRMLLDSQS